MALIEGKAQKPSTAADSDHGSMRHADIKRLMGEGGSKVAPAVRRGGHDHRQGPAASEGEAAVNKLHRDLKKRG